MTEKQNQMLCGLMKADELKVLFVCLGNICRSPAADAIMHSIVKEHGTEKRWTIDSAGTGNYHVGELPDPRMRVHGRRRGLTIDHICRQIKVGDFDDFDLIIGMDASNVQRLKTLAPTIEAEQKVMSMADFLSFHPWYDHIPDPYYDGDQGFEIVLDLLEDGCNTLYNRLSPQ